MVLAVRGRLIDTSGVRCLHVEVADRRWHVRTIHVDADGHAHLIGPEPDPVGLVDADALR